MTVTTLTRQYPLRVVEQIVNNHLRISSADGELYDNAVRCVRNAIDAAEDYINMPICRTAVLIEGVAEPGERVALNMANVTPSSIKLNGEVVNSDECIVAGSTRNSYALLSSAYTGSVTYSIEAKAGYDDSTLPGAIYQAVAIVASSFFEQNAEAEMSHTAKALLNHYRIYPYEL